MRKFVFAALSVAAIAVTDYASADPLRVGFGMDVGAPSGGAVGVVVNPGLDWARLQASLTCDSLSFGGLGSLQFAIPLPFANCPIGLVRGCAGRIPADRFHSGTLDFDKWDWSMSPVWWFAVGKAQRVPLELRGESHYINIHTNNFQTRHADTTSVGLAPFNGLCTNRSLQQRSTSAPSSSIGMPM